MENYLNEINAVLGVIGSFVCLSDGSVAAKVVPDRYDDASVETAARIAMQTVNALEVSGQRIAEADLVYGQGRLVLKNLRGGVLFIICSRNINVPLLNLTANVIAKKIATEIKPSKPASPPPAPKPAPARVAAVSEPATIITGTQVSPSPLFVELEQESNRLTESAKNSQITLCAIDPISIWQCCPQTRKLVATPEKRYLDFASRASQSDAVARLFERMGYQSNQRFNEMYGTRRLNFLHSVRDISADVYLDAFEMYHRLDLTALLSQEATILPETPLALFRLQLVEMPSSALSELCALLLEHELSVGPEEEKIDASEVTRVCADDWGWYKTVTTNLDQLVTFAPTALSPSESDTVIDRVQRLRQSIDGAPKSLRWQTRARIGETMRWYETPLSVATRSPGRPDLAIG